MLVDVSNQFERDKINEQICYMLHIRDANTDFQVKNIYQALQKILSLNENQDLSSLDMNYKVLVVLIEQGFIQTILNANGDKQEYPKFLIKVLASDKNYVKEACCRMIIKYFAHEKNQVDNDDKN